MDGINYKIILRHDTSTNWVINNPVLLFGEYGIEDDTHRVKRGDGESKWSELLYETFGIEDIITNSVKEATLEVVRQEVNTMINNLMTDTIQPLQQQVQQNTEDIEELKREDIDNSNNDNNQQEQTNNEEPTNNNEQNNQEPTDTEEIQENSNETVDNGEVVSEEP